ncbi:helix-turn-helix transcriptional regulator [Mycobacterium sp. URHB0044]|uniref:helix-turn-helix transcriptional regulator n=1 Tax=Mycobacterium sp. URHB0044 TaxID=1380386 RepID=UPI00048E5DF9|nr:LuxR family transcriptional regulator [Mycobacterium sp. URHB0044]
MSRPAEARAVAEFLTSAAVEPSALVVQGEAGIGKTTLWLAAVDQAREQGFRVLSARAAQAESVLAYGTLADLLADVDEAAFAHLPGPQRLAVDRVLLRAEADLATDQRAVAAAFLSVVTGLADDSPVLLAVDDLQWLDPSSQQVIAFAARRLVGPVGVLGTVRTDADGGNDASWLQLPKIDELQRITLHPLSLGSLREVLSGRLGRSFSRQTMIRIHQVSGGNPFYALELARPMDDHTPTREAALPSTLNELVRVRIDSVDASAEDALLAMACLASPTVELVAAATGTSAERVVSLLGDAESTGIVGINGNQLRFTHPLLARGVYTEAAPARRREMHRRLADLVDEPELRARHLAMAATSADPRTIQSLDEAAQTARSRGAPAAAAELVELAVGLGGDTPERRIQLASHLMDAGEPGQARTVLETTIKRLGPGTLRAAALYLLAFVRLFDDSFLDAAGLLERGLAETGEDLALRIQMLTTLAFAHFNADQLAAANHRVEDAITEAERLGEASLLSQALSMRVMIRLLRGDGLDQANLRRALDLEDHDAAIPSAFRPSVQKALLLACIGELDQAHEEMGVMRRRYVERGEESELIFIDFHTGLLEIWRGAFAEATRVAEDLVERALLLGGDLPRCVALAVRASLAAYAGRLDQARDDASEALAAGQRSSSHNLSGWPVTILGFVDVSLGNYEAALTTLQSQVARLDAAPDCTEIIAAAFVPDAVEAMIAVGRLADAEPLIDRLERNGQRVDRPWMLAIGARCRAMLLAAQGDIDAANRTAQRAMVEHDRLPMPFERARTQLLLGQIQRRQRQKDAAAKSLREVVAAFDDLGTPLWADRARAELARVSVGPSATAVLTPSEQRVAQLAASGMTNRDVAAALFISPKTVEANLARIYHKLGIRSRAELGRRISQLDA